VPNFRQIVDHICALERLAVQKLQFGGPYLQFRFDRSASMNNEQNKPSTPTWTKTTRQSKRATLFLANRLRLSASDMEMVPNKPEETGNGKIIVGSELSYNSDLGDSPFFAYVVVSKEEEPKELENRVDQVKRKFLSLLGEEKNKNDQERKQLEERIQQEEQLRNHLAAVQVQRQHDELTFVKEIQVLALENLQLKEGMESLQAEIKRLQQDRGALQDRIKSTFTILDQENKHLKQIAEGIGNELGIVRKEKKVLIDQITAVTLGKTVKRQNSTPNITTSSSVQ